jgi:hypothetical protein
VPTETLSFATRIWFAWLCFFQVLFDGRFAARAWDARRAPLLASPEAPAALPSASAEAPTRGASAGSAAAPSAGAAARDASPSAAARDGSPSAAARDASPSAALQLLSLLQREGRLVDFLQQEIASFSDADIGAAARVVHEGCRKALRAHATIEPVRKEDEGARVTLPAGFAPDEVKLVGDVKGEPPYAGVLRHRGWRATRVDLPQLVGGHDVRILAAAEVELG